jgi:hypothetical protein
VANYDFQLLYANHWTYDTSTPMSAIRNGLATNLATITGLRVPAEIPDNPQPPTALLRPESIEYNNSFSKASGTHTYTWVVLVIVGRASERMAQKTLDEYADPRSSDSIKAAIESDQTLDGAALDCRVTEMRGYQVLPIGENQYLGAEFVVTIIAE